MNSYELPLPSTNPESQPFWRAAKEHRLMAQRCRDCEKFTFVPRNLCSHCLSESLGWVPISGKGEIYSFTTVQQAFAKEWSGAVPYVVVVVQLDEDFRMVSNLVDCAPHKIRIGMKVEAVFEDVTKEISLPKFRPTEEQK